MDARPRNRARPGETRRTAHEGTHAMRNYGEPASEALRNGGEATNHIAERSMEQLSKVLGLSTEVVQQNVVRSSNRAQMAMDGANLIAGACEDISGEWMRFAQSTAARNLDLMEQLLGCRNVADYVTLQAQIFRENFEAFLGSANRTSERSRKALNRAARRVTKASLAPE